MRQYDVVIVGSGLAGGLAAAYLSNKGLRTLILEAGPHTPPREKLVEKLYMGPNRHPGLPYDFHPEAPKPSHLDIDNYYVQIGPNKFRSTYERCVGGTTWHWLRTCLRLLPVDFRLHSTYKVGIDWPISYDELETWYNVAESSLGVAGDNTFDLGSPRSKPYPKKPINMSPVDRFVARRVAGQEFNGLPLDLSPNPQARDPDRCMGSASCIPVCPIGAKYEARQHIELATQRGAHLLAKAVASKIHIDQNGAVESLEYTRWDRSKHKAKGKIYLLAAGAIETTKLLLMSASERAPQGVANRSDQVGRNLMDHPIQLSWALAPEPIYPYRGPASTSGIDGVRDGAFRSRFCAGRLEVHNQGWSWPTGGVAADIRKFVGKGMYGEELRALVKSRGQRELLVGSLLEQLPSPENRITLARNTLDGLGIPRPKIYYGFSGYEKRGMQEAQVLRNHLLTKLNCTEVTHGDMIYGAGHIMGTYRMGLNPKTSVVDANLRSHDHQNLYLLGSGVFPTVGSANPALTIAALAERCARHLESYFI